MSESKSKYTSIKIKRETLKKLNDLRAYLRASSYDSIINFVIDVYLAQLEKKVLQSICKELKGKYFDSMEQLMDWLQQSNAIIMTTALKHVFKFVKISSDRKIYIDCSET